MHSTWKTVVITGLLAAVGLTGCAPAYAYDPFPPRVSPALGEMRDGYASVRLFYATDRRPTAKDKTGQKYSGDRTGELRGGTCRVSIPRGHGRGRLESPALFRSPKPQKHVLLSDVSPAEDGDAYWRDLREQLGRSTRKEVFVFVHGYAATFAGAIRRTAQIAHDVEFDGVAITYSWPAQGGLLSYLVDASNADWTLPHLVEFLTLLVDESGAQHIHLMAHSMGCRVLSQAVKEFVRQRGEGDARRFDQIILAAGDIDAELFERDHAPYLMQAANRVTIYTSKSDWVLGGSQKLHRYARLGQSGPPNADVTAVGRLNVVDASAVDKGLFGHQYYGSSPTVLEDLVGVLRGDSLEARGLAPREPLVRLERR